MDTSEIKTTARNFYESYNQKDLDKSFDDYISLHLVNHTMGGGFDRDKWKAYDKTFVAALSDLKVTIVEQVAEGNKVASHVIMEGKHTGDFAGMSPSGNTINLEEVSIDVIKDNKIIEHRSIADFTGFMQQFVKKA